MKAIRRHFHAHHISLRPISGIHVTCNQPHVMQYLRSLTPMHMFAPIAKLRCHLPNTSYHPSNGPFSIHTHRTKPHITSSIPPPAFPPPHPPLLKTVPMASVGAIASIHTLKNFPSGLAWARLISIHVRYRPPHNDVGKIPSVCVQIRMR
jgi:hypothetical protein